MVSVVPHIYPPELVSHCAALYQYRFGTKLINPLRRRFHCRQRLRGDGIVGAGKMIKPRRIDKRCAKRCDELELRPMQQQNTAVHETAFTISIDLLGHGCTTGISAYDRATGIQKLTDPDTMGSDYARPGHIIPLIA